MPIESMSPPGLSEIVKKSFTSLFDSLNLATESWFQKTKLLTVGRDNYADFIANGVGIFPLFGTSHSVSVESAYIKVELTRDLEREKYRSTKEIEEDLRQRSLGRTEHQRKDFKCYDLFEAVEMSDSGLALVGNAGSGKTTAFRHLAVEVARGKPVRGKQRLPVYVPLRDMIVEDSEVKKCKCIESATAGSLDSLGIQESKRVFHSLARSGHLMLMLDGLDEVDQKIQKSLLQELDKLRTLFDECILCISARPYSLSVGLPGFTKWEPVSLSLSDRVAFVEKWFRAVDPAKGTRFLEECRPKPGYLDLGSNPLLLSIVCALYHNDLDIPADPEELYDRALSGLLGGWDAFRNVARSSVLSNLTIAKRMILLSWLAADLLRRGKIIFTYSDVDKGECLERATEYMRIEAPRAEDLLKSLYNDFGILTERSPGKYSFTHLTFHEYLAAKFYVDYRKEIELVTTYRRNAKWFEVIKLVAKLLPDAGDYMSVITWETSAGVEHELRLLLACWRLNPVCSPETRRELMSDLATMIATIISRVPGHLLVEESRLIIETTVQKSRRDTSREGEARSVFGQLEDAFIEEVEVLDELDAVPSLLELIQMSGYSYCDLRCEQSEPFKTLMASCAQNVEAVVIRDANESLSK